MTNQLPGPCPVCGKRPNIWPHQSIFGVSTICDIECHGGRHGIKLKRDSKEEAVRDWNELISKI